jgi:two-component sensor histidine kinase
MVRAERHPHVGLGNGMEAERNDPNGPVVEVDGLFLQRARLCLLLILGGIAVVFVGWIVIAAGRPPLVGVVQGANMAILVGALGLLRDPSRSTFNHVVGFLAYAATIAATGMVGIVAGDATTPLPILVGMAVIAAAIVPWSPWWQLASVVLTIATAVWTVASLVPEPRLFWVQSVGAITPTLIATVFVSRLLRRQRAAVWRAEQARRSREQGLREVNVQLEQEIEGHRRTETALRFAMRELDHRVKNTLAIVQSVADQTLRSSASMPQFAGAFSGRIQALARIHVALAEGRWAGLPLSELIELVAGPYRHHPDSLAIDCDGVFVSADVARVLGMALHELATNAAKYGALSMDSGRIAVTSQVEGSGPSRLRVYWNERNGPRVGEPPRRGFGMRLIEEAVAYEFDGQVTLRFPSQGVQCELEIPLPPRG